MMETACKSLCELETPKRNRYYFGQLLDVAHFKGSDRYFNTKRWMLNRLVGGFGVVCGLNVRAGPDGKSVIVEPGLAIDKWGREIVVPEETPPIPVPKPLLVPAEEPSGEGEPGGEETPGEKGYGKGNGKPNDKTGDKAGDTCEPENGGIRLHVLLCYHECETKPEPVYAGGCKEEAHCQPGSIEERYKILIRRGCLPDPEPRLRIPGVIKHGACPELDYAALAKWVSRKCPECPRDPCIPLANLRIRAKDEEPYWTADVDISVRPICFTNDLLFQLVLGLVSEQPDYRTDK